MAQPPKRIEPARDAAALLRRLGFAILVVALPAAGLVFRRGVVVLLPIGAALLVVAAALDGQFRPIRDSLDRLLSSTGVMAGAFAALWAVLSLAWTPGLSGPGERLAGYLVSPALGFAAYLALPDRTRSANLYLAPVGAALAAVAALGLILLGSGAGFGDDDGQSLERGLGALALLLWPSIAWLRSRGRDLEAASLTLLVGAAVGLGPRGATVVGLAVGAIAYLLVVLTERAGALLIGGIMALVLVAMPAAALLPEGMPGTTGWGAVVRSDAIRLVTGHGLGEFLRGRVAGAVPATVPDSAPIQVWYDLGTVGALALALALPACLAGAARSYGPLLPGVAGGVATAFALASFGIGSGQAWWPACLTVFALLFVAAERGQFRTRRPRADGVP